MGSFTYNVSGAIWMTLTNISLQSSIIKFAHSVCGCRFKSEVIGNMHGRWRMTWLILLLQTVEALAQRHAYVQQSKQSG